MKTVPDETMGDKSWGEKKKQTTAQKNKQLFSVMPCIKLKKDYTLSRGGCKGSVSGGKKEGLHLSQRIVKQLNGGEWSEKKGNADGINVGYICLNLIH